MDLFIILKKFSLLFDFIGSLFLSNIFSKGRFSSVYDLILYNLSNLLLKLFVEYSVLAVELAVVLNVDPITLRVFSLLIYLFRVLSYDDLIFWLNDLNLFSYLGG